MGSPTNKSCCYLRKMVSSRYEYILTEFVLEFILLFYFCTIVFAENKFAVGSGGRVIAVCYFVSENNWWLCKHIKRPLRSTVTTVDWHPGNKVLVAGSTDYKVRVFSAFISDMEDAPGISPWGQSNTLGTLLAEFPNTPNGGKTFSIIYY